ARARTPRTAWRDRRAPRRRTRPPRRFGMAGFLRTLSFEPLVPVCPKPYDRAMHDVPVIHVMDVIGPLLGAAGFVAVMSLVREPARRNLNALLVAGSTLAYLSGGFGVWELVYPAVATPVAYLGLRSYRFIALGWLMHAAWDVVHHLYGHPIWPF